MDWFHLPLLFALVLGIIVLLFIQRPGDVLATAETAAPTTRAPSQAPTPPTKSPTLAPTLAPTTKSPTVPTSPPA